MTTTGEEKYLRSSLLLLKGGTFTTRKIVIREEQKEIQHSGRDLDDLLNDHKRSIENEFRNYNHREKLFPADGKTKVEDWDISLLTGVLKIVFRSSLSEKERKAVRSIKHQRNDVYAHTATANLSGDDYSDICAELKEAFRNLTSEFSKDVQTECENIIDSCIDGPIDIKTHIEHLKRVSDTDSMFRAILDKIDSNGKQTIDNMKEIVGQEHVRLKRNISEDISNSQDVVCRTVRDTQLRKADLTTLVKDAVQEAFQEQKSTRKMQGFTMTDDMFNYFRLVTSEKEIAQQALQDLFETLWNKKYHKTQWTKNAASVKLFEEKEDEHFQNSLQGLPDNERGRKAKKKRRLENIFKDDNWKIYEWDTGKYVYALVDCKLFSLDQTDDTGMRVSEHIVKIKDIRNGITHFAGSTCGTDDFVKTLMSLKDHISALQLAGIDVSPYLIELENIKSQEKPVSKQELFDLKL